MSGEKYEIDTLDRDILRQLQKDARKPFLEIARELGVSGGTIHQRYDRLKENEVILSHKTEIDPEALGYQVQAFIGVHVNRAQEIPEVIEQLQKIPNILEAHYTTGNYALFLKVCAKDMQDYYFLLMKRLQKIKGIRSTESYMCMAAPIEREFEVAK